MNVSRFDCERIASQRRGTTKNEEPQKTTGPQHTRLSHAPMKQKLTNNPLEIFRTLPDGIRIKIYRFTVHVFDSRSELIEAVDLHIETRYGQGPHARASRWPHRPIGEWDVASVTDFSRVFYRPRNSLMADFNEDLSFWDVSNGTDFGEMFWGCNHFNADLFKWNVSRATDLSTMFFNCHSFNADLSNWNVSNVTDLGCMFYHCWSFNADLSQWNVSNARDLSTMFSDCRSFNADVSQWNVSNSPDLSYMFRNCWSFNADVSQWNVSNARDLRYMFSGCHSFNETVVAGWPIAPETRQLLFADVPALEEDEGQEDWRQDDW
jgi:surface protein